MNQLLSPPGGTPEQRMKNGLDALKKGRGVLVSDNSDRENEVDLIFAAHSLTRPQMALLIRECSGIVCLCLPEEKVSKLGLAPMVRDNTSPFQTAFTVSIEAASGVTTGVSAADRLATIQAAIAPDSAPASLNRPGHVFPLAARPGGVLERQGHTEAAVDLMTLAGLPPYGVLCELTNPDGTMARLPEAMAFGGRHHFPVLTVQDIVAHRHARTGTAA